MKICSVVMMSLLVSIVGQGLIPVHAQEVLRYSCSAQVVEAFGSEGLNVFTHETGIQLSIFPPLLRPSNAS